MQISMRIGQTIKIKCSADKNYAKMKLTIDEDWPLCKQMFKIDGYNDGKCLRSTKSGSLCLLMCISNGCFRFA